MSDRNAELVHGYLDDFLSIEKFRELESWIQASPENARFFSEQCALHDQLRSVSQNHESLEKSEQQDVPNIPRSISVEGSSWRSNGFRMIALALTTCLLVALGQLMWPTSTAVERLPLATVAQTADVTWGTDTAFEVGDRLVAGRVSIAAGIVRLQFDDGVNVTLQGPAELDLVSSGHTTLHKGLLTAAVPAGAEGFRVDTPMAEVVDLGTAFGVQLDEHGQANVAVFDGEVEVSPRGSRSKRLLREGESLLVSAQEHMATIDFDVSPYEKVWPVSSGIVSSTGAFEFAPPWPRPLKRIESDSHIFVVPEGYSQQLVDPVAVDIVQPGTYSTVDQLVDEQLSPGTVIKSYLLQFNPVNAEKRRMFDRLEGTITFDQPILGLIVRREALRATDNVFANQRWPGPQPFRELELNGLPIGDHITLSDDGRTVTLNLVARGRLSDHVRVIVKERPFRKDL